MTIRAGRQKTLTVGKEPKRIHRVGVVEQYLHAMAVSLGNDLRLEEPLGCVLVGPLPTAGAFAQRLA